MKEDLLAAAVEKDGFASALDLLILCPITREPIRDEVVNVADGFRYERAALDRWLAQNETSPMTRVATCKEDVRTLAECCDGVRRVGEVRSVGA